jgi:hypothetical protein
LSGLLTWAESHKKTRRDGKPRYRNLINEKTRCVPATLRYSPVRTDAQPFDLGLLSSFSWTRLLKP